MWPFNKRNITLGDVRPDNGNAKNIAAQYGLTERPFVRILYSHHSYYNDSDFVAQVLSEIIDRWGIYEPVHLDRTDGEGKYEPMIHGEIGNPNCKVIIIFAKDSFENDPMKGQSGHSTLYREMELCVKLIKLEKKKDNMFFPVYIVNSEKEIPKIKEAIIDTIKEYDSDSPQQFTFDLKNTLFALNGIQAPKPNCTHVIKIRDRETYMRFLEGQLEDKQFKRL